MLGDAFVVFFFVAFAATAIPGLWDRIPVS